MKSYIIICCFADKISGGPIYYANKARYMEEQGWNVVVIPADTGEKSAVPGLDKFFGPYVPYLGYMPSEFNCKQRERIINQLIGFVPANQEEIIIETGTDYTAYWGEMLAERKKAKHVVIFLDEQNPFITADVIGFYKFKYQRNELACITRQVMQNTFKGLMDLTLEDCRSLPCSCTNSIDDYNHPLTDKISTCKYNIGYIGRLEKPFFPTILNGFIEFCKTYPNDTISVTFFGGAYENGTTDNIRNVFKPYNNVKLTISGYLYPYPLRALRKMDVFVSGAGSATVGCKAGVYSVRVDMLSYQPIGIQIDSAATGYAKCPLGESVIDYLKWILVNKEGLPQRPKEDYKNDWQDVCKHFGQHVEFLNKSSNELKYYNIVNMSTAKGRKKRLLRSILGVEGYEKLHSALVRMKKD